ncbi:cytochrome c oxidase subunit 3 [Eisenibacter elegans]|jgi:cytochrome c oxidase subunit 3|uniref:cytochrome c oxidase subunit 3 n=1 Tax=Eisenibacter elegans TaxID=997 RepID=UPI00047D0E21|nr:cytochrome c oxidase subunit 3 [Eisenibacter elegans]
MANVATINTERKGIDWNGGNEPLKASWGKLMMWFFLLSDAFTFSALLITYGTIRYAYPAYSGSVKDFTFSTEYWPIPEKVFEAVPFISGSFPLVFVGIMTFILIMSSVTMVLAVEAGHRRDRKDVEKWMFWTIIGGITFLASQAWEWTHFIHGGPGGAKDIYGNVIVGANLIQNQYGPPAFADLFFFITGFHGLHVTSGVVINIIIFYNVIMGIYDRPDRPLDPGAEPYEMVEKVGLYWHFVDLVWVFVFTFFYLV